MARHRRRPEPWRIRFYLGLIRQVRGKPLLEALHRLQNGVCAYDEQPCALLLPQVDQLARFTRITREHQVRFSTVDHIVPRFLGGENKFSNLVMASQTSNAQKGAFAPIGRWVPRVRHAVSDVERKIVQVENGRWALAEHFARNRRMTKEEALELLVTDELTRIETGRDFKFYGDHELMVA